jgi:hypothetical protein
VGVTSAFGKAFDMYYLRLPVEISIGGVFMPPLLVAAILGALVALAATRYLRRLNLMRFVWHPPLFFLALVVIFTTLIGIFLVPT